MAIQVSVVRRDVEDRSEMSSVKRSFRGSLGKYQSRIQTVRCGVNQEVGDLEP